LEHSLKTISHAVLLDTVMREQEEHQQQQRNEL
uniref:Transcriptional regulator n=1 Tax=Globodera pallida TaxID=36090 RepID=A0A183CU45_GLOPA